MKLAPDAKIVRLAGRQVFRPRDVKGVAAPRARISQLVEKGALQRVAWGLYVSGNYPITENHTLVLASKLHPKGVVCLLSAAHYVNKYRPFVFERIKRGKKPKVLLRDDTLRTLIRTRDASRATALIGNTWDAYGQTWHLSCDGKRLTYRQFIERASEVHGRELPFSVVPKLGLDI